MKSLLLIALLLAGCGGSGDGGESDAPAVRPITVMIPSLTPQYEFTVEPDIVYGQGEINGGETYKDMLLDLYVPTELTQAENKRFPLMLMFHGGGFYGGSKSSSMTVTSAEEYARRGWLVASIDYRLQADNPVPSSRVQVLYDVIGGANGSLLNRTIVAAIDDALSALDYLERRGDVYRPYTVLWGFSAGATLALMAGYLFDDYGLTPPGAAAVIEIAGTIDGATIGTPFDDPVGSDPVLMILHSMEDFSVPFSNAVDLQAFAEAAGLTHDYQPVVGSVHVLDMLNTTGTSGVSLLQGTVDFMQANVFGGQAPGPMVIR